MLKIFSGKIGKISLMNVVDVRKLPNCNLVGGSNHEVIYQKNDKIFELEDYRIPNTYEKGISIENGSRFLIKGWLKIVRVGNFYQLFPLSGSFGFSHGIGNFGLSQYQMMCDQEKLETRKRIIKSYLVDDENNIAYEVEELIFPKTAETFAKTAETFDLFNRTKQIALFKGRNEVGLIDNKGEFHPHTPLANIKVDPITQWWLNQHN